MSTERIPCKKCRLKILRATAEANDGMCGQCARKSEEASERRRQAHERKEEAKRPIEYDIDAILAGDDFMTSLDGALPEPDDPRYPRLMTVERHLQSLAEFDRRCLSGFDALVVNQYFDLLSRTRKAARQLKKSLLVDALNELENTLRRHRFPRWVWRRAHRYASLSDSEHEALDLAIQELDAKYFMCEGRNLWSTPDFRDGARDYAKKHVDKLRMRRS